MSAERAEPTPINQPRRRRIKGMDKGELHEKYPSLKTLTSPSGRAAKGAWVAAFKARPDAMEALLGDYIKQVHAKPGRIGQRPMPKEADVDFDALVYGETTERPLTEVLPELVAALPPHLRSERNFAAAINMSRTQYHRLRNGEYSPDVKELQMIAKVVGKPVVYFAEYRKSMVVAAMLNLMDERPGIATMLYRQYIEVQM